MKNVAGIRVTVFALIYLVGSASFAQVDTNCVKNQLPKISSDGRITLYLSGHEAVKAKLMSYDTMRASLTIHELWRANRGTTTYSLSEIQGLKFTKSGKMSPKWMIAGLLSGVVVVALLPANNRVSNSENIESDNTVVRLAIGAGISIIGFIAGTIIPVLSSTKTIECGEVP